MSAEWDKLAQMKWIFRKFWIVNSENREVINRTYYIIEMISCFDFPFAEIVDEHVGCADFTLHSAQRNNVFNNNW